MLIFPQLQTGTVAQFPISRTDTLRALRRIHLDGSQPANVVDEGSRTCAWNLSFTALSTQEMLALQELFEVAEGRLKSFTFLDPADNLLRWSEDLTKPVWTVANGLSLTGGLPDAFGRSGATNVTNSTAVDQQITQGLPVPSAFRYHFGLYLRSESTTNVTLFVRAGSQSQILTIPVRSEWSLASHPVALGGTAESVHFGFEIRAGDSIEICGAQVQAHTSASTYKPTGMHGGVYTSTRFDQDALVVKAEYRDQYSTRLRLISRT
jgi:hypothetical protein